MSRHNSACARVTSGPPGYSLLEVILAVVIFSIMSIGILRGVMQVRTASEYTVYNSTALTVATGFIEQIKAMTFTELEDLADGSATQLTFVIASGEETTIDEGVESEFEVQLDANEDGETTLTMDLHVIVQISPIDDMNAVQVDMLYGYKPPLSSVAHTSSISTIVTGVPTF